MVASGKLLACTNRVLPNRRSESVDSVEAKAFETSCASDNSLARPLPIPLCYSLLSSSRNGSLWHSSPFLPPSTPIGMFSSPRSDVPLDCSTTETNPEAGLGTIIGFLISQIEQACLVKVPFLDRLAQFPSCRASFNLVRLTTTTS